MSKAAANYRTCLAFMAFGLSMVLDAQAASAPNHVAIEARDFRVPARDAGVELHLSNKLAASLKQYPPERIVLFVHGATFPSSSGFDVDLPGGSWMSYVAERGFDVYALDIRGYGASTRPAAMSQPPENNPPFADTREAVRDISAAVDFILARRHAAQLTLIGWSWGTTTTASYAAQHPEKIAKLILSAPVWIGAQAPQFKGAYRTSTHDAARAFCNAGIPTDRVAEISPPATFDAWWAATQATDPQGAKLSPPVVRAPNGALKDIRDLWAADMPAYDPARIRAPTLLVVGEWDSITPPFMAQQLYSKLVNASERRLVLLSEGTHCMAIEKNRMRLIREVQNFLDQPPGE